MARKHYRLSNEEIVRRSTRNEIRYNTNETRKENAK